MADELPNQDRIPTALQALHLHYRYEARADGNGLWHVPFDLADGTTVMLTLYSGPLVAGVLSVVGDLGKGWKLPSVELILQINADLWLTKLVAQDSLISVTAQLPANQVDAESLRLAISGVIDGVSRIRLAQSDANTTPGLPPTP